MFLAQRIWGFLENSWQSGIPFMKIDTRHSCCGFTFRPSRPQEFDDVHEFLYPPNGNVNVDNDDDQALGLGGTLFSIKPIQVNQLLHFWAKQEGGDQTCHGCHGFLPLGWGWMAPASMLLGFKPNGMAVPPDQWQLICSPAALFRRINYHELSIIPASSLQTFQNNK